MLREQIQCNTLQEINFVSFHWHLHITIAEADYHQSRPEMHGSLKRHVAPCPRMILLFQVSPQDPGLVPWIPWIDLWNLRGCSEGLTFGFRIFSWSCLTIGDAIRMSVERRHIVAQFPFAFTNPAGTNIMILEKLLMRKANLIQMVFPEVNIPYPSD